MQIYPIFIGYDPRQNLSYNVLCSSITVRASAPIAIVPLKLETLPLQRSGLTPFTFSRFLVPHIVGFQGAALFLDSDMLCLGDIVELFDMALPQFKAGKAACVVKNKEKFEWAALIMFNCSHPKNRVLTPDYVEHAEKLHWLGWLDDEDIGEFPAEWSHTVMYDEPRADPKLVHYTGGIPVFPETVGCEHTEAYHREMTIMGSIQPWPTLMGRSVHAKRVMEFAKQRGPWPQTQQLGVEGREASHA